MTGAMLLSKIKEKMAEKLSPKRKMKNFLNQESPFKFNYGDEDLNNRLGHMVEHFSNKAVMFLDNNNIYKHKKIEYAEKFRQIHEELQQKLQKYRFARKLTITKPLDSEDDEDTLEIEKKKQLKDLQ